MPGDCKRESTQTDAEIDPQGDSPSKPGPKPERLKIEGDWKDALRTALRQERPEGGWPDHEGESGQEEPGNASESDDSAGSRNSES